MEPPLSQTVPSLVIGKSGGLFLKAAKILI